MTYSTVGDSVTVNTLIMKYRLKLLGKSLTAKSLSLVPQPRLKSRPPVTLFISSMNTRYPLALTIQSMVRCTNYPDYKIVIGENASTDGSLNYLQDLQKTLPIEVISASEPRMHKEWLSDMFNTAQTPYWFAVDSDMLFLGRDWLYDMVKVMEANPSLYFLAAEHVPGALNVRGAKPGEIFDTGERPSTWLFCVRAALRDHMKADFGFYWGAKNPDTGRNFVYDVGGKFLADMRAKNLDYTFMPSWFLWKYHHFGSLSWNASEKGMSHYRDLKLYQLNQIRQMVNSQRVSNEQ